jgi:membrane protease YdiL (CAAX protease family)
LLPVAGTAASMPLTVAFGVARFDPEFTKLREMAEAVGQPLPATSGIVVVAQAALALTLGPLFNTLFAVGEEIGWRGFLLPRLMRAGLRQWPALVVSGVVWGLWHAPVIALGHNYPDHPYVGVVMMTVFCTLLGVAFGWLQLASGSVWVPALAHGSTNAVAGMPLVLLTPHDSALGGMLTSVIGWLPLIGFVAWLAWSGRLPVAATKEVLPATPVGQIARPDPVTS